MVEDFNPRSREGSDVEAIDCRPIRADFNPRSREGSDVEVERMWYKVVKFQSTLPRRERHRPASKMLSPRFYFNPRSLEGSDIVHLVMLCAGNISIHAPAKGATFAELQRELEKAISIHAPAKGATPPFVTYGPAVLFQSTLPRRERR